MLVSSRSSSLSSQSHPPLPDFRSNPTERYSLCEKIGQGGFGYVYKAIDTFTGEIVAAKLINLDEAGDELEDVQQEISVMSTSSCQQLTKYYASYLCGSQLWIVMEYLEAGSLSDILSETGTLDEDTIAYVLRELVVALAYLHSERKIHRDIKAGNILVSGKGAIKLADFGVTGQLTESVNKRQTRVGTPYWMAPEVITETSYDSLADIWSVGITAIELAQGKPPYAMHHPMQAIFLIPKNPPPMLEGKFSPLFKNFISACLQKDPSSRCSASMLLRHPFLTGAPLNTPRGLMDGIASRLKKIQEGDEIDRILDHGSRSNSYSRISLRRSVDSGGWDFDLQTVKKGYTNSYNNSINSFQSHDDVSMIHVDVSGCEPLPKKEKIHNSSSRSSKSDTSSQASNKSLSKRTVVKALCALKRTASEDRLVCGKAEDKTVPTDDMKQIALDQDDDDDSEGLQGMDDTGAFACVSRVLLRNHDYPTSDIFKDVVDPVLKIISDSADEMRGDSEETRRETKGIIFDLTRAFTALDKQTDGGLTAEFVSTIFGFMVESMEGDEAA